MRRMKAAALLGLIFCAAARADDPAAKKYDLDAPDRWEAGDVSTETLSDDVKFITALLRDGSAPAENRRYLHTESRVVRRCLEVDASGAPSKSLLRVTSWVVSFDDAEDKSLEGALVETTADGWTLLSKDTKPSAAARKWLDEKYGPGPHGDALAEVARKEPAAVGESWEPREGSHLASVVRGQFFPFRIAKPLARVTLTGVDATPAGDVAHLTIGGDTPVEGEVVAPGGRKLTIEKGGTFTIAGTAEGTPGRWHRGGSLAFEASLDTKTNAPNGTVQMRVIVKRSRTSAAGGEFEGPAARDPAAGPEFRVSRRVAWKSGDVVSDSGSSIFSTSETPVDAEGKAGKTTGSIVSTTWSDVRRCTETSAAGEPTRFSVWIKQWKSEADGLTDECLAGALVDVGPKGWKLQNPEVKPTAAAKAWLARECGTAAIVAGDDPMRAVVTPLAPVTVGESWSGDETAAASVLRSWIGLPVDPAGSTVTAKLDAAKGDPSAADLTVSYQIDGLIACVAGCNCTNSELLQGGTIRLTGRTGGAAADWTRSGELSEEMKATVSVPGNGDALRRLMFTQTRKRTRTPGGELPQQ